MPHTNGAGIALIERFEGERLRAYPDPGTGGEPWTIGYGHICNVHPGQVCTPAQALSWLTIDVAWAETAVANLVTLNLTPNAFSALVSFQYNTGALGGSHLLQAVNANAHDRVAIAQQFGRWVYAGGAVMPGLVTRRTAETNLFFTP